MCCLCRWHNPVWPILLWDGSIINGTSFHLFCAYLQSTWCILRRSFLSQCWLKHSQSPHWSNCSEQSTEMSRRSSWRMARRSTLDRLAASLSSCYCWTGPDPVNLCHLRVPPPNCSTGCDWPLLLSWYLEINPRLPAGSSAVTRSMAFPSVWQVHEATLVKWKESVNFYHNIILNLFMRDTIEA